MPDRPSLATLLFCSSILFTACVPWKVEQPPGATQRTNAAIVERNGTSTPRLELDHGERWVVDPLMWVPIRRMHERITSSVEYGATARLDHRVLADSLFADLDALVAGCTMDGKAHEELHDWLMPHMQLVQDLEKAPDTAQARAILEQLAASSAEFDQYFQDGGP